ncbi:hypothetical protein Tco_0098465 [Tanacetum coccineum]
MCGGGMTYGRQWVYVSDRRVGGGCEGDRRWLVRWRIRILGYGVAVSRDWSRDAVGGAAGCACGVTAVVVVGRLWARGVGRTRGRSAVVLKWLLGCCRVRDYGFGCCLSLAGWGPILMLLLASQLGCRVSTRCMVGGMGGAAGRTGEGARSCVLIATVAAYGALGVRSALRGVVCCRWLSCVLVLIRVRGFFRLSGWFWVVGRVRSRAGVGGGRGLSGISRWVRSIAVLGLDAGTSTSIVWVVEELGFAVGGAVRVGRLQINVSREGVAERLRNLYGSAGRCGRLRQAVRLAGRNKTVVLLDCLLGWSEASARGALPRELVKLLVEVKRRRICQVFALKKEFDIKELGKQKKILAEYMALTKVVNEAIWLRGLFEELVVKLNTMAVKEVLEAKTVEVLKVGTEYNDVDALTNVVPGLKLQHCLELLSFGVG